MNERPGPSSIEGNRPKDLGLRTFGASIASSSHPERNEDSIVHSAQNGLAIVLDGVGGAAKGDIASRTAAKVLREELQDLRPVDITQVEYALGDALRGANYQVREETNNKGGTTAVVAKVVEITPGNRELVWASVGDSRVYLMRNDTLSQVTVDDNPLQYAHLSQDEKIAISESLDEVTSDDDLAKLPYQRTGDVMGDSELSRYLDDEAEVPETVEIVREMGLYQYVYSHRNWITQMVGSRDAQPRIGRLTLEDGDKVILTSDGIHDNLAKSEIEAVIKSKAKDPAQALVDAAKNRADDEEHYRAKPDDISAVVVEVESRQASQHLAETGYRVATTVQRPTTPRYTPRHSSPTHTRRSFGRPAIALAGVVATLGLGEAARRTISYNNEVADRYKGLPVTEYVQGHVSVDLNGVNIRTAPKLDEKYLKKNNPEGRVIRMKTAYDASLDFRPNDLRSDIKVEPVPGPIVEVNGTNIEKAKPNQKLVIANPAVVRGELPSNPNNLTGTWLVVNTKVKVPGEDFNIASSPGWGGYTTEPRTFFVYFGQETADAVKYVDPSGKPTSEKPTLVPLAKNPDGTHVRAQDKKPVSDFGKVSLI